MKNPRKFRRWSPGMADLPDERGSMAILMMVVLVGVMLGSLLIPTIVTQARTTRFDITRVQALDAAQSGIDVALGAIRSSTTSPTNSIGDITKLPCGPASGSVDSGVTATYSVQIEYFTLDPVNPSSSKLGCSLQTGTFDPASLAATAPGSARLTSTGTVGVGAVNGSTAGRTLTATYTFRTPNIDILGGLVRMQGSPSLCMDAGPYPPADGTPVSLQLCINSSPPAPRQVFAYRTDLTLQLTSSVMTASPDGLCLQPAATGNSLVLKKCNPLGLPPYTQQWNYSNLLGQYQATLADSATTGILSDQCLTAASSGQSLSLSSCTAAARWAPSPSVGLGATASPQWANDNEFGRCLDVSNEDVNHSFLIDYPCKQNPYAGAITWNQLFQAPAINMGQSSATGQVYTTFSSRQYCLTSPGNSGGYVTVSPCLSGNALQSWTRYNGDKSLNYSMKYTMKSGAFCLGLGLLAPEASLASYRTIDVEPCTGATSQKWNAVPNLLTWTLSNVREN